jgi:hypothetical protein
MIEWQPIATAPKDRHVLLAKRYGEWDFYIARWECPGTFQSEGWTTTEGHQSDSLELAPDEPTHWAELEPPA